MGGGGILKDEGMRMPFELLLTAVVGRLRRRPVALLAVGVGPIYTRLGRAAIKAVAQLATYRSVRDQDSADELARIGVDKVVVAADPVFCMVEGSAARTVAASGGEAPAFGQTAVVSVRPWFGREPPARWERFSADVAASLAPLEKAGLRAIFVALYWPRDRDAAGDVKRHLTVGADLPTAPSTLDTLLAELGMARLAVVMRYHALVLAAAVGCPVVAIAYEPKVAALAATLGIPSVAAEDPDLRERLRGLVEGATTTPTPPLTSVERLRGLAHGALIRALSGQSEGLAG